VQFNDVLQNDALLLIKLMTTSFSEALFAFNLWFT
jgi:hypothetical protein